MRPWLAFSSSVTRLSSPLVLPLFLAPALAAQRSFVLYQAERRTAGDLAEANKHLERANLSFATALVATLDAGTGTRLVTQPPWPSMHATLPSASGFRRRNSKWLISAVSSMTSERSAFRWPTREAWCSDARRTASNGGAL